MARLWNCTTGEVLAERISLAGTPWSRAIGYLLRRDVDAAEGLWFDRCSTIHTFGLRAVIDVVFLDSGHTVVGVVPRAERNRIFHGGARAVATLEIGPGMAQHHRLALGDRLRLE